jgi:transposase
MPRRTRRAFPPTFKAEVVRDLLSGKRSSAELCREHQLSPSLLALWKDTALERLPLLFQGEEQRDPAQARIAELEQLAGRQALELEILKKASRLLPGTADKSGRSS